jgi:dipeptidyl aminopeptidase/acylaminoacyl peptidase
MARKIWHCALLILVFAIQPSVAAPPPPEAFGSLPAQTDVTLSPDGHWLAWVDHKESKPHVIMFDVSGRKVQRILSAPENTKLRGILWSDSETLLIFVSQTKESKIATNASKEYYRTIAENVSGGDGRMLPMNPSKTAPTGRLNDQMLASLVSARGSKPHTVIMSTGCCLLEVDTQTGLATVIKTGNEFTVNWVVDRAGHPVAREDWDWHGAYRLFALSGNNIKEILRKDDSERPKVGGLLADGSAVVLLATNGRSHQVAWALPLDGSPAQVIVEDKFDDITNLVTDPYSGAIIGADIGGSHEQVHWLDAAAQHRSDVLLRSFPGRRVEIDGWSQDGTKVLARVETPSSPPVYYLVDFTAHKADIAAEEYPDLAGLTLGEVKEITYKARDGSDIPGYLTMPAGKSSDPVPLVVLPHGGPQARDHFKFDWLAQFLASRGYAVLQPQFRGSTGFGEAFRDAGYHQWGGLMQDDVTDGVRAMIDQHIADPQRVCIVGASYGGYAALAGAAFTPELYACAVSISGVSDIPALLRETLPVFGGWSSTGLSDAKERIGAPNDPKLAARSPINSVKTIRAPILLMYGTGDGVVPTAQSQKMASALSTAGKSVRVVTLQGEDHWLSRTETRTQVLRELDTFLGEHIAGK